MKDLKIDRIRKFVLVSRSRAIFSNCYLLETSTLRLKGIIVSLEFKSLLRTSSIIKLLEVNKMYTESIT
jgi:hypothetical protein